MKSIQKYFLAIVPPEPALSKYNEIKEEIRRQFAVKYALKSPPHITLKMPFSYNESKEAFLLTKLSEFLEGQKYFPFHISGIGNFGQRVIFQKISPNDALNQLQAGLKIFCKRELHLIDELSDRNFHPHLTLAFKDLKPTKFERVMNLCRELEFEANFQADRLCLLKREGGYWKIQKEIPFGNLQEKA
jgi:2'-5' RNA ligase